MIPIGLLMGAIEQLENSPKYREIHYTGHNRPCRGRSHTQEDDRAKSLRVGRWRKAKKAAKLSKKRNKAQ